MNVQGFTPIAKATQTISATQTNTAITWPTLSSAVQSVRVYNAGPNVVFIDISSGTAASATTDMPIVPGTAELFCKGFSGTLNAICATGGTATLYVTPGEGV